MNEFLDNFLEALSERLNFFPNGKLCAENDCRDHIDDGTYIYNILSVSTLDAVPIDHNKWMHVMMGIECALV